MPLRFVGGLQHHCVILWAVSTLKTKAFIAASCHAVVLLVRPTPQAGHRSSCLSVVWLKIFVTFTRYFPSRVQMTFSLSCTRVAIPTILNFAQPSRQCRRRSIISDRDREIYGISEQVDWTDGYWRKYLFSCSATMYDSKCMTTPVAENTFDSRLVFVLLSFVGSCLVEVVPGHPRLSLSGTGVPWVSLPGPTSVKQSAG